MRALALAGIALALLTGCAPPAEGQRLTVFAAASLSDAVLAAVDDYRSTRSGLDVAVSTGSSATLRAQIEQGAPADVYLAADTRNPQALADAGLADGQPRPFAVNLLAVVVPRDNRASLTSVADLTRPGVRIIAAGEQVPISSYATQLVDNLAGLEGYPADFAARYAANVVTREDDVRAVLAKVVLGEGDAAIVYATDARSSTDVTTLPIPDGAQVAVTYAGVVVAGSGDWSAAHSLLEWLAGPDGQAVLARFGFSSP